MSKIDKKKLFYETGFDDISNRFKVGHQILWALFWLVIIFIIWAYFSNINEYTRAQGKVIPSQKIQLIRTFDGGFVSKIVVKEAEQVKKGQLLMEIDSTRFASTFQEGKVKAVALQLRVDRLRTLVNQIPFKPNPDVQKKYPELVMNELELYDSKKNEMQDEVSVLVSQKHQKENALKELLAKEKKLSDSFALIKKELDMTTPLVKQGVASEVELLRLQRATNDLQGELKETQFSIPEAQAALAEIIHKLDQLRNNQRSSLLKDLADAQAELSTTNEANIGLQDKVNRSKIYSPVNGIIKKLNINTIGGAVVPGDELLEVVPSDGTLLIEGRVKPADVAFLSPGKKARVRVSAFDFSIYGGLDGVLESVSADTLTENARDKEAESYYVIYVRTDKDYIEHHGKKYAILPGMTVTVDILTGHKTVLEYLLKPLIKAKFDALREK